MIEVEMPLAFQDILRAHLPYAESGQLTPSDELTVLGMDSMSIVQLLAELEDSYAIELPDEILNEATFATVGSLWETLSEFLPLSDHA